MTQDDFTTLIARVNRGDTQAEAALVARLYGELRAMAARAMRGERSNHTLQATALANEALMRLLGEGISYTDKLHFMRLCATTMRRVLVDYARARSASKRGGAVPDVTLNDSRLAGTNDGDELALLSLDAAIDRLEAVDPRKAKVSELHFFSDLDVKEIADAMSLSESTVARDIRFVRAWLKAELGVR